MHARVALAPCELHRACHVAVASRLAHAPRLEPTPYVILMEWYATLRNDVTVHNTSREANAIGCPAAGSAPFSRRWTRFFWTAISTSTARSGGPRRAEQVVTQTTILSRAAPRAGCMPRKNEKARLADVFAMTQDAESKRTREA